MVIGTSYVPMYKTASVSFNVYPNLNHQISMRIKFLLIGRYSYTIELLILSYISYIGIYSE